MLSIGQTIRKIRREKNMSQKNLAKLLCVSKVSIWAWETGKSIPTGNQMIKILKTLNIKPKNIIFSDPKKSS